jgi:hypothetical protein
MRAKKSPNTGKDNNTWAELREAGQTFAHAIRVCT